MLVILQSIDRADVAVSDDIADAIMIVVVFLVKRLSIRGNG
jgi:hypothetical protein